MADSNDVYISGIDPSIPGWATENTMASIRQLLASMSANTDETNKALDKIYTGESGDAEKAFKVLHDTLGEARQQGAKADKANADEKSHRTRIAASNNKIAGYFEKLIRQSEISNEIAKNDAERQRDQFIKRTTANNENITEEMAGQQFDSEQVSKRFNEVTEKLGKSAVGILATTKMINSFMGQQAEDRFNMAQEIRQSGLMAGFSEVEAGLEQMSAMINENNFTLGEAAEFTKRFSRSVGMVGVEASLKFANSLTKSQEAGGLDMMGRFGLEFGEVTSLAGEYLDSLRNMGVLDRMSQQQLRDGMDDFMSGVSSTANVLKINLEDAAKMISQTLQRDDVTSRLVTMDPNRADRIRETIGSAGMMEGVLGQAVIERMAAGSQGAFVREQTFQQLSGTGLGKELLPIVERLALAGEQGPEAFQSAIADLSPDIQGIIASASTEGNRAVLQQNQFLQSMIADLSRLRGTIEDADKGPVEPSQEDKAVLAGIENRRQAVIALEDTFNNQVKGFTDILGKMNTANAEAIETYRRLGTEISPFATMMTEFSGEVEIATTKFLTNITDMGADLAAWGANLLGIRDQNADAENEKDKQTTDDTISNLQTGENNAVLDVDASGDKSGLFFDNDSKNMFDEIRNVLDVSGANQDAKIEGYTKDLVEQLGMFDNSETFDEAKMQDLMNAITAIKETDSYKTEQGQENIAKMLLALEQMNVDMSSFWKSAATDKKNTDANAKEQEQILTELKKLVKALNEN